MMIEMLTKKGYEEGADELLSYGPQVVCVTLGEKGCYVATREKRIYSPVKEIVPSEKIKDKIGAGDVFAAGFLMGASKRCPLENCAEFANIVAAESIQGSGRNNYPTRFALLNYYISQA
jgi:sugar/nucleoside kinase (ribokinase family)